jgi:hypothetical protein
MQESRGLADGRPLATPILLLSIFHQVLLSEIFWAEIPHQLPFEQKNAQVSEFANLDIRVFDSTLPQAT